MRAAVNRLSQQVKYDMRGILRLFFLKKRISFIQWSVRTSGTARSLLFLLLLKAITQSFIQRQALVICIVNFDPKQTTKQQTIVYIDYRCNCFIPKEKDLRLVD